MCALVILMETIAYGREGGRRRVVKWIGGGDTSGGTQVEMGGRRRRCGGNEMEELEYR